MIEVLEPKPVAPIEGAIAPQDFQNNINFIGFYWFYFQYVHAYQDLVPFSTWIYVLFMWVSHVLIKCPQYNTIQWIDFNNGCWYMAFGTTGHLAQPVQKMVQTFFSHMEKILPPKSWWIGATSLNQQRWAGGPLLAGLLTLCNAAPATMCLAFCCYQTSKIQQFNKIQSSYIRSSSRKAIYWWIYHLLSS